MFREELYQEEELSQDEFMLQLIFSSILIGASLDDC